jgi:phosphohistidine phosphatase
LIVTSTARRARRTAQLVARTLDYPKDLIRLDDALYLASPEAILAVIAQQDETVERLLLVGHNPGLTDLANRLLPELCLDNLPTAGIVAIDSDTGMWAQMALTPCRLTYFDFPKNLDAPVTGG